MSNNNNKTDNKQEVKKEGNMYVSLLLYAILGLALGYAVAKGVMYIMNKRNVDSKINIVKDAGVKDVKSGITDTIKKSLDKVKESTGVSVKDKIDNTKDVVKNTVAGAIPFMGKVSSNFEGDNNLDVNFNYADDLKVTQGVGAKSKYFYAADSKGNNVATVYMSYEGGRGYTPTDYAKNVIAKAVPNVSDIVSQEKGDNKYTTLESANSRWNIVSVKGGKWLAVVENKKAYDSQVVGLLESLNVK